MNPSLTVVYITSRPESNYDWFLDSLINQAESLNEDIHIILVDYGLFLLPIDRKPHFRHHQITTCTQTSPKPTVWQGVHRITKSNWWAASNARNTGICLCQTDWIAFVDDRCVLTTTWLQSVREAMDGNYVVFGSYEKRHGMTVENGIIKHGGIVQAVDGRETYAMAEWKGETPHACGGEWAFGCTLALPLELALQVNGYDENCDGLSMEDVIFGVMLQNNGFDLRYDYRMKIIEDRTPEHCGPAMIRRDKGISPNDKSHALLNSLKGLKSSSHPINLRQIRADVLAGKPFPAPWGPTHDFWDHQPVSEM